MLKKYIKTCFNTTYVLKPDKYYTTLEKVNFNLLASKGILNIILDVDNTISRVDLDLIEPGAAETINKLKNKAPVFKICLVSNVIFGRKRRERVAKIAQQLDVPYVAVGFFKRKPNSYPYLKAMEIMGSTPENTAVIGDQLFTDILGAKKLGIYSILVRPLGKDHWTTRLFGKRRKERALLDSLGIKIDD